MPVSRFADASIHSTHHGGPFAAGQPRVIVVHSTESEATPGTARAVAHWLQRTGLSVHYIIDTSEIISGLDESLIGWGAGTVNSAAIHIEFCGRAAWTSAQWGKASAEIDQGRKLIADIASRHGIPLRFTTDDQLRSAWRGNQPGGVTTHAQCTKVLGGTTHTDPGAGFPLPLLIAPKPSPPKEMTPLAKAQARYQELLDRNGVSDAAARHFDTALNNVYKAVGPKDIEAHVRRLGELMQGKPIDLAGALHLQTALRNIRKAGGK